MFCWRWGLVLAAVTGLIGTVRFRLVQQRSSLSGELPWSYGADHWIFGKCGDKAQRSSLSKICSSLALMKLRVLEPSPCGSHCIRSQGFLQTSLSPTLVIGQLHFTLAETEKTAHHRSERTILSKNPPAFLLCVVFMLHNLSVLISSPLNTDSKDRDEWLNECRFTHRWKTHTTRVT